MSTYWVHHPESLSHAPIAPMASTDELQRKRELLLEQKRLKEQELASITSSDSQKFVH